MFSFLRKIPGFRSGKWWKALIASGVYLFIFLAILVTLFPPAPTLALEKVDPTNKNFVSIAGKTYSNKPVYLLKDNEIVQSIILNPGRRKEINLIVFLIESEEIVKMLDYKRLLELLEEQETSK